MNDLEQNKAKIRTFETGATRDIDQNKYDFEGFLSPIVLERFAEYMHKNRLQADGSFRDSDNWQKGIPKNAYMKSLWRHFFHAWKTHRGYKDYEPKDYEPLESNVNPIDLNLSSDEIEEDLCGILFNTMGYLHEYLKQKKISSD